MSSGDQSTNSITSSDLDSQASQADALAAQINTAMTQMTMDQAAVVAAQPANDANVTAAQTALTAAQAALDAATATAQSNVVAAQAVVAADVQTIAAYQGQLNALITTMETEILELWQTALTPVTDPNATPAAGPSGSCGPQDTQASATKVGHLPREGLHPTIQGPLKTG